MPYRRLKNMVPLKVAGWPLKELAVAIPGADMATTLFLSLTQLPAAFSRKGTKFTQCIIYAGRTAYLQIETLPRISSLKTRRFIPNNHWFRLK
jgi:hypothetical protein